MSEKQIEIDGWRDRGTCRYIDGQRERGTCRYIDRQREREVNVDI